MYEITKEWMSGFNSADKIKFTGERLVVYGTRFWRRLVKGRGFPGGSVGEESACKAGDWAWSLDWEDLLEKGRVTHSSIFAWRIHGQRSLVGYSPQSHRVGHAAAAAAAAASLQSCPTLCDPIDGSPALWSLPGIRRHSPCCIDLGKHLLYNF